MNETLTLKPAAAETLARWHQMIDARDLRLLPELLNPQAVFRSPMAFKPYESAAAVSLILNTVVTVFEDFVYHRELASADGLNVVLEFSARVGDRQLMGVDIIQFDSDGLIVDFEVMVRPASGLQALGDEMGRRLAPQLAALSAGSSAPSR